MDLTNNNELKLAVISFFCAAIVCALNLFLNTNPIAIISYVTASCLYFIYSAFSSVDNIMNADYIQSGEGSFSLLFFFIAYRFLTDNIILIFPFTVIALFLVLIFIQKIHSQEAAGYIINPLIILVTGYLFYFDKEFSIKFLKNLLTGLALKNYETVIFFFITFIICLIFIYKFRSAGTAISHGKNYSNSKAFLHYLFLFIKSFIIVSALYLTGVAGFAAYYLYRFLYKGKINIRLIFVFIFIHLAVLLSLKFTDPLAVSFAVIFLSLISHFIYKLKKVDIYGRSIRYKL